LRPLNEIFRYAAVISGNNMLTSGINFGTFLIMINALGTYGFGLFTLAMSIVSFATFFIDAGFSKVVVSDVTKDIGEGKENEASGLFQEYSFFVAGLMAVISIIVFLMSGYIADYFQKDILLLVQLISGVIFLSGVRNIYTVFFQVVADFEKYALLLFGEALAKLVFIYTLLEMYGNTVESIFIATIIAGALTLAVFLFLLPKKSIELFRAKGEKGLFVKMLKGHGKWTAVFSQLRSIENGIPVWIVEYFLGLNSVGVYGALIKVQTLAIRVFEPLETIFFPLVSRYGKFDDSRKIIFRATKYIFYLSIPMVLGMIIFAETILEFILGGGFSGYANAFRILLLTVFTFILNIPMKPLFFNLKAQKTLTFISAAILASTIIFGSVLTMQFGIFGIALNHVLTPTIEVFMKSKLIKKISKSTYSIKEIILPDKADIDLVKKIIKNPKTIFGDAE